MIMLYKKESGTEAKYTNKDRRVALIIVCLLLAAILFISFIITDHHCSREHCALCILSASVDLGVFLLYTVPFACCVLKLIHAARAHYSPKSDTLVELKRKLTI